MRKEKVASKTVRKEDISSPAQLDPIGRLGDAEKRKKMDTKNWDEDINRIKERKNKMAGEEEGKILFPSSLSCGFWQAGL